MVVVVPDGVVVVTESAGRVSVSCVVVTATVVVAGVVVVAVGAAVVAAGAVVVSTAAGVVAAGWAEPCSGDSGVGATLSGIVTVCGAVSGGPVVRDGSVGWVAAGGGGAADCSCAGGCDSTAAG
ncbi:MAG: hypothetical protein JOZ56_04190, partial [Actinobacteria bacterium]|nr:hypothetical protein [Actinomycetota bacterium]